MKGFIFVLATAKPVQLIDSVFDDMKAWILYVLGGLFIVTLLWQVVKWLQGDDQEKREAGNKAKKILYAIPLTFIGLWLINYLWEKFKPLNEEASVSFILNNLDKFM